MYNVFFGQDAHKGIDRYIIEYTKYYEELYSDTGIWSEDQIVENYKNEGYARYDDIIDAITHTLEKDIVSYIKNEVLIRWRTRVLIVRFYDEGNVRVVKDVEIR